MGLNAKEQAVIDLVINGQAAQSSLRELTGAYGAMYAAVSKLRQADDPKFYEEQVEKLRQVKAARDAERQSILSAGEAQKTFFSDFKEGFEEIERIAAGVTIGTLISKGVQMAIEKVRELFDNAEKAYKDHEMAEASLANKIRATGDVSGETMTKLKKYQETLEAQTGIDETVVAKGEDVLLTYTNIRGKIYDQALPAVLDYTAAMHNGAVTMEGVQESAQILGKGLDDVSRAKRTLRQMGIDLSAQEDAEIQQHRKNNDVMGAQQIIIDLVNKRYGDLRNTLGNTDVGKLQKLDTAFEAISRRLGSFIISAKAAAAEFFLPFLKQLGDTHDSVQKLSEDFYEQAEKVKSLEEKTEPLLVRYDQLKSKSELNRQEQKELNNIIHEISQTIPTAVTQWDKYGNAIGINTEKAREYIKMQQAVMKIQNKDAIDKTQELIDDMDAKRSRILGQLSQGTTTISTGAGAMDDARIGGVQTRALTNDEILKMTAEVKELAEKIDEAKLGIRGLKGENIELPDKDPKVVAPVGGLTPQEEAKAEAAKEKAKRELEQYVTQLREARDQVDQLIGAATKGTAEGLDAQLKVINDKYEKIIAKLKDLNLNKLASAADKNINNADILAAKKAQGEEVDSATAAYNYNAGTKTINDDAQHQVDKAKTDSENGLLSKEGLAQKEYDIEQKRLKDLYDLQVLYGVDTTNLEKLNADNEIRQKQRVHDETIKLLREQRKEEEDFQKVKEGIEAAKADLANAGMALATQLFGKSKEMMLAELAIEKIVAIGKIEAAEGVEIAKYWMAYGWDAPEVAAALSAAAVARADLSIATIIVSGIAQAIGDLNSSSSGKKAAKGGYFEGSSHSDGGLDVYDSKSGEHVVNVEGGEPWMVLSNETRRNNGPLIKELLFNSMYRNGAAVNTSAVGNGIQYAKTGAIFSNQATNFSHPAAGQPNYVSSPTDLSRTNELLEGLHGKFDDFSKKPWQFPMKAFYIADAKNKAYQSNANA